jgi:hypothetical protein
MVRSRYPRFCFAASLWPLRRIQLREQQARFLPPRYLLFAFPVKSGLIAVDS